MSIGRRRIAPVPADVNGNALARPGRDPKGSGNGQGRNGCFFLPAIRIVEILARFPVVRIGVVDEVEILQLTDLLIGAISYINRDLSNSKAKVKLVEYIKTRSGYSLTKSTLLKEHKFNLLNWQSAEELL